ncbi:MAG TPA: hypothetical protein VGE44_10870 [Daejeonella sp.]|uniref:hypothetical protein n=1 Tax=Daejeonella sp. TaxID=2805397 RepID=UPI002EDBA1D4
MQTLKINLFVLLMLIILSSCSTRKLNKQILKSSVSEQSEIRMKELKNAQYEGKRMILMTDSADVLYTISIIPKDTFSFSVQQGFRGKAQKIEVRGLHRRVKSRSDSTVVQFEQQSGRDYEEQKQSERSELLKTRSLVTERWSVILVFIVLAGIILIGWGLRSGVMKWFG